VFPARYELNSYIVFRKRLVSQKINEAWEQTFCLLNCIGGAGSFKCVRVAVD
jgi:hypothetical protein